MTKHQRIRPSKFIGFWFVTIVTVAFAFSGCGRQARETPLATVGSIEIVAHRGASFLAPENTLAAARLAWARGSDAVEVDVHLSRDKRIVAIHDGSTARTGGKSFQIARTDSRLLRRLDVGGYKGREFIGERIPFLDEILDALPETRRLFVEIKCGPEIIPILDPLLTISGKRSQIVVIGFGLETMRACKETMPDVPVYWLCGSSWFRPYREDVIAKTLACGLDGLDVHHSGLTPAFVHNARAAGLDLYVWTIDDVGQASILSDWGVDGITTNRPAHLLQRIDPAIARQHSWNASDDQDRKPFHVAKGL